MPVLVSFYSEIERKRALYYGYFKLEKVLVILENSLKEKSNGNSIALFSYLK